jgi:glycosyltransferase involved in cell wall biosynthesis
MELVGDMLLQGLTKNHGAEIAVSRLQPSLRPRFGRFPVLGGSRFAWNIDRLTNRFLDYPRWLRQQIHRFDLFHIVDHSYSQLAFETPPDRTIVTCHDLNTFRCLLEPGKEPRSRWFRMMSRKILDGFERAAHVICVSESTRDALLMHAITSPDRVSVVANCVHPSCSPEPNVVADAKAARLLGSNDADDLYLLHVGSVIPRKRIDVLLQVFAAVHKKFRRARLVRVGGDFTDEQSRMVKQLGLEESIVVLPSLDRDILAAVYRQAAMLLQTSDSEGFGLPVLEAMACGCPVVASDLAVLREVAGSAAVYCPVAASTTWSDTVIGLLHERNNTPETWITRQLKAIARTSYFSWAECVRKTTLIYHQVLNSGARVLEITK